jgi:G3E family GTPase
MVTLVDAVQFLNQIGEHLRLADADRGATPDDERTVADLLVDQVEFADRIYVTKADLVSADRLAATMTLVRRMNPRAAVDIMVEGLNHGASVVDQILGARLYSEATARTYEGYTEELENPHTPETEEYGISSVVFRGKRPLDRGKLLETLRSTTGLVRSKGYCWIADRPELAQVWHQAGPDLSIRPAARWESTGLTPGNEVVLIGVRFDSAALLEKLEDAMVPDTGDYRLAR